MRTWKTMLAATAGAAGLYALSRSRRPDTMDFAGRSVVIAGGSRGLGLVLARRLADEGARLTLLARDEDELEAARRQLRHADVQIRVCDVRDQDAVRDAVSFVRQTRGGVDVLINCAGVIQTGPIDHMEEADFRDEMDVHFWGPLYLMREVIPIMKRRGGGRIVNISSIGGLVAVPHLVPYSASKFALTGLSDGMRAELAPHGIRVTTVCPGLMRTGSHRQAWFKGRHEREFDWFAAADANPLFSVSVTKAARRIVEATRHGRPRLVITPQARLAELADTLLPNLTASLMGFVARLLPDATGPEGDRLKRGYAARGLDRGSLLTVLADKASRRNNEMHDHAAEAHSGEQEKL